MDNKKELLRLRQKAEQLFSEKNWERLLSVSSEIIKLTPKDDKVYVYRGIAQKNLGDYKGAISNYTKAIKIKPDNDEAYANRGITNAKLNEFQDAINDYDKALKINPNNDNAYVARSFVNIKLGNIRDAINDCNKALKINPNNDEAYINRGIAKTKLDDAQDAIDDYNKALEINKSTQAYINRGIAKIKLGDIQGAIDDYNKALEINEDAQAYANRGAAKGNLGDYKGAIKDFDKALEINPSHIQAIHSRGAAHALIESKEEQEKTIKKLDEEYKKQIADHEKQLTASRKEQKETIKKLNEEYEQKLAASQKEQEKQWADHNEQLQQANRYEELVEIYKREFNCLSKQKEQTMTEIKDMVIQSLIILTVYLLCIFIFTTDKIILLSFLPALTMASLYLFPQIWSMRNIERDRNRYWALREDAYTKWILTLSAHQSSINKLPISKEFREKLLLKLFEHHNNSNTPNIILNKHDESGKSDINNIVRNFAFQKDDE